jgi:ATP-dependent protease ClpP protease subunit
MKKRSQRRNSNDDIEDALFEKEPDLTPVMFEMPGDPDAPQPLLVYLYKEIGSPENYIELCHALQYAEEGQDITFRINTPGGSLHACASIVNAMLESRGNVYTILDGDASSAGAVIWMAGDVRSVASPHVTFMIHGASCGYGVTKLSNIKDNIESATALMEGLLDDLAVGIVTEEERIDVRKGVDVYLSGTELMRRLDALDVVTEV